MRYLTKKRIMMRINNMFNCCLKINEKKHINYIKFLILTCTTVAMFDIDAERSIRIDTSLSEVIICSLYRTCFCNVDNRTILHAIKLNQSFISRHSICIKRFLILSFFSSSFFGMYISICLKKIYHHLD